MKKIYQVVLVVCLAVGLAIALAGCSSGPNVYDKSVPIEQSSTIKIIWCFVTQFDGVKTGSAWWAAMNTKQVIIPAGTHTLKLFNKQEGFGTSSWGEVDIKFDFTPGNTYLVFAPLYGHEIKGQIIDETHFNRELTPDPASPNASQFEGKWVSAKNENNQLIVSGDEYIWIDKGVNQMRGYISYDEKKKKVSLSFLAVYYKDRWQIMGGEASNWKNLNFNGTTLMDGKTEFKRVQ